MQFDEVTELLGPWKVNCSGSNPRTTAGGGSCVAPPPPLNRGSAESSPDGSVPKSEHAPVKATMASRPVRLAQLAGLVFSSTHPPLLFKPCFVWAENVLSSARPYPPKSL